MRSQLNIYTSTLKYLSADIAAVTSLTGMSTLLLKRAQIRTAMTQYLESETVNLDDGDWELIMAQDRGVHGKMIYLVLGLCWGTHTQRILKKKDDSIVLMDKNWNEMLTSAVVLTDDKKAVIEQM